MVKGKNLFTIDEVEYLRLLHKHLPMTFHNQDVNLFYINKTNISHTNDPQWEAIQNKLLAFHGKPCPVTNYFLKYGVGSYAATHKDNPITVDGTAITLLDKSDDLEGGNITIVDEDKQIKMIPQLVGQTLYYDSAVIHGVSKVTKGTRIVLITWFRKDTWQN